MTPLATTDALQSAVSELTALIDNKQAAGDYLVAADLKTLEDAVAALESGKATVADLTALQTTVTNLGDTYATDAELKDQIDAVKLLIPTVPTNVSAFTNDAGYLVSSDLADYARNV